MLPGGAYGSARAVIPGPKQVYSLNGWKELEFEVVEGEL